MKIVNDIINNFTISSNRYGKATLNSGSVTVSSSIVTSNSIIIVSYASSPDSPTSGLYVGAISPGTSFKIFDDSGVSAYVNWFIVKI